MSERATMAELFEFANKVRAAGGGNPIDALMPAVPEDQTRCLIARNLNFNCAVNGASSGWHMSVDDEAIRDRIRDSLGLEESVEIGDGLDPDGEYVALRYSVRLPEAIGQVAADFDLAGQMFSGIVMNGVDPGDYSKEHLKLLVEMEPYIEASKDEAYNLAEFVNPDGSIVT